MRKVASYCVYICMCVRVSAETKISPTLYAHWVLPLVRKEACVVVLLSCSLWRHDVSFSPSVDMVLHLAHTPLHNSQCLSVQMIDTDVTLPPNYLKWILLVHTP